MYSWTLYCHCTILSIIHLWSLVICLSIINNFEIGWHRSCYCWSEIITRFVSSHGTAINLHIHTSEVSAGFRFVKTSRKFTVGISKSSTMFLWWIMLSKYFCSISIISHASNSWFMLLWWDCGGSSCSFFCFLLFFNCLELFDFVIFHLFLALIFHLSWILLTWPCWTFWW